MIVLAAFFQAKPGREAELEAALRAMIPETHKEAGALEYVLHRAKDDASRFFFYEKYRDQTALDAHAASSYLKTLLEKAPELCASAPVVTAYEPLASIHD